MYYTQITNPKTGRVNRVKAWHINPRAVMDAVKAGAEATDISWRLLSDDQSLQELRETAYEEEGSNFALSIFEGALDWSLGLAVVRFIHMFIKEKQALPKPFSVVATRKGDVFCVGASGHVYQVVG